MSSLSLCSAWFASVLGFVCLYLRELRDNSLCVFPPHFLRRKFYGIKMAFVCLFIYISRNIWMSFVFLDHRG